ncbi:MAG: hypothetical protein ACKVOU_01905 [Cytophagales bacterium]
MQKNNPKIFYIFSILFLVSSLFCRTEAQNSPENRLNQADQLFIQKKYTQSFKIYEDLYITNKKYSPQSLLKMAFIKEALGENTEALFYLNAFYESYPDKKVFNKMKEIAEKEKLEGYQYSDLEFFANLYRNYHDEILFALLGFVFIYFLAVVTNKIFIKGISNSSPLIYICFLLAMAYVVNFGENYINPRKNVCISNTALIMSSPSAGSKLDGYLAKGTRVSVMNKEDIWVQIKYGEKWGYVRRSTLVKS